MSIVVRDVREHELDSVLALNNAAGPAILPLDAARLRHFFDHAEYFRVAERGGTLNLIQEGWFQKHIADFAYETALRKQSGEKPVIGVNLFRPDTVDTIEVRKVDKDAQKITIKHGSIKNLDMPPMTMVFRVKDAALLDAAKAGDKVMFRAEQEGGQYFVMRIEPAK